MMANGLLDGFGDFIRSPEGQGLLSGVMGYAANARQGTPWNNLGRGGLAGIMGYSGALDRQAQAAEAEQMKKYRDAQLARYQYEIDAAKKAEADKAKKAAIYAGRYTPEQTIGGFAPKTDSMGLPIFDGTSAFTPMSTTPAKFDATGAAGDLFKAGFADDGFSVLDKFKPKDVKLKEVTPMKDPQSGKLVNVALYEDGTTKVLPYGVKPDVQILGLGDRQQVVDKNDIQPNQSFAMGQSPDSKASNALGWANHNVSRERLNFDKAGGADGVKPKLVGEQWVTAPTDMKAGEVRPAMQSTQQKDAREALQLIETAKTIIPKSTGSYVGAGIDQLARGVGISTGGDTAAAQLKALEGSLVAKMPKMSGPQSDKDVLLYKQMAGEIGDPTIPQERKLAALKVIEEIQKRHSGVQAEQPKPAPMDSLPSASQYKGRTIRDMRTGKMLTSNGMQWVEAQ